MKLVRFLLIALSVSFVPVVGAQQPATKLPIGRHPVHRMANQT